MKTYKQRYLEAINETKKIQERYNRLNDEYSNVVKKSLDNTIVVDDISFLKYIVEGLRDIASNGGSYSAMKAKDLLYTLGELK